MKGLGALALLVTTAVAVCGSSPAATTPTYSTVPMMYITYSDDCTFTFTIDGGIVVDSSTAPGTQIPPGPYQLSIKPSLAHGNFLQTGCVAPIFQLTGPGVSYSVNPITSGFDGVLVTETFQPGATYVAVNPGNPSLTQKVFTTATTGTSSSLLPPPPPPDTTDGETQQTDLIGSGIMPFRGTLRATVASSANATLLSDGRRIATLKAGRYQIVVQDSSASGGFFVQKHGGKPLTITGVSFTGKRTVKVDLTAGTWTFYAKRGAAKTFAVRA